ncbi:MAG: hypothetical protein ACJAXJ_004343, partial [Colwellia sp.]
PEMASYYEDPDKFRLLVYCFRIAYRLKVPQTK